MDYLVAGVDEAGRGPLAGPVVAAAVILDPAHPIHKLKDSKKLSETARETLFAEITEKALAFSIAYANVQEIDELNILQASLLAMSRAVMGLSVKPQQVLVDGNQVPKNIPYPVEAIIQGDDKVAAISAASILAKVTRDREMLRLDAIYPGYGFAKHKGYPTQDHLLALAKFGVSDIHRTSYAPVRALLAGVA